MGVAECSVRTRKICYLFDNSFDLTYQICKLLTVLWGRTISNINPLTPNDPYSGRTAPLTYERCILYIYSTNISTEYFKLGMYSPFLSLQNAGCFIILTYLVPVLFTLYVQGVLKLKKKSGAGRLIFCMDGVHLEIKDFVRLCDAVTSTVFV